MCLLAPGVGKEWTALQEASDNLLPGIWLPCGGGQEGARMKVGEIRGSSRRHSASYPD